MRWQRKGANKVNEVDDILGTSPNKLTNTCHSATINAKPKSKGGAFYEKK